MKVSRLPTVRFAAIVRSISFLFMLGINACVDPFFPSVEFSDTGFLVVVGYINSGGGPTVIRLSRTVSLPDEGDSPGEVGAEVVVESSNGDLFHLNEAGGGEYQIGSINVEYDLMYRLNIRTSGGKEYISDFEPVRETPPIDSVVYEIEEENKGLRLYVYTHDPDSKSRYYNWEVEKTWEYRSFYESSVEYKEGEIVDIDAENQIKVCWKTAMPATILVGTSEQLKEDVIHRFPVAFIGEGEVPELVTRYSVLVRQFAIDKEIFNYLTQLKKTSEGQGSLFDPQPFQLIGNVHSLSDPDEPVIGYVSVGEPQEKRIFFFISELPIWFSSIGVCPEHDPELDSLMRAFPQIWIPKLLEQGYIAPFKDELDSIWYYRTPCVDCREGGGTNKKPDFWN